MASGAGTAQAPGEPGIPYWSPATRLAFRFCFLYFGLYCLLTQILTGFIQLPDQEIPDLATRWPLRLVPQWAATHLFRITAPLAFGDTGSGDRMFDWVLVACLLAIAALGAGIWSLVDSRRRSYLSLHNWFRVFLRFALAGQMLAYGFVKVVPMQMPFPFLTKLVEPFGNFSPMGVLWASIGASPAYERFAGSAEMLAGVLLILPRTALLGALVCLADVIQVFMLNMTYDVPVKLLSFHLILMTVFLLAPERSRLAAFFFSTRATPPSSLPPLCATARGTRIAVAAQLALGVWLLGVNSLGTRSAWHQYGEGRPKSVLYGIWNVEQLSVDGEPRPPLLTDTSRWRRAIFNFPAGVAFQRMDDTFVGYGAAINLNEKSLVLTKGGNKDWKATFRLSREPADHLTLDGDMDGHATHIECRLVDHTKFVLATRGFHWIQEFPFNR
ncbi:MAG TPA: DoxX family protein [Candidatus Binatia bacterium]|nr:DoxX family protein [Candidatus Binatia bacterium]